MSPFTMKDEKRIKLDTRFRYSDKHYVGYVLEVINRYLGLGIEEYHLGGGGGPNISRKSAEMTTSDKRVIRVTRVDGDCFYAIEGWPSDRDFEEFQREAERLLREVLR